MTISTDPIGASIAPSIRTSSDNYALGSNTVSTVGGLLDILRHNPPPEFPVLKTTCSHLAEFLGVQIDKLTIDMVNDSRNGFRAFLIERRRHKENAVRSYVNHVRILLKYAEGNGWMPGRTVPESWKRIFEHPAASSCTNVLKFISRHRSDPRAVTLEEIEKWADEAVSQGLAYGRSRREKNDFWRLLRECECLHEIPLFLRREKRRSVRTDELPTLLREELRNLLQWKLAEFSVGRPKGAQLRPVSADILSASFRQLYHFASSVRGQAGISSLAQLIEPDLVSGYLEWSINVREMSGYSLQKAVRLLFAAVRQYPKLRSVDVSWWKALHDSIPVEPESERRLRKAQKCPSYGALEKVPSKIRAVRTTTRNLNAKQIAILCRDELLIRWLLVLPWRQKNIRECRIGGPSPNLFKASVPSYGLIDRPVWVQQEQQKNPEAVFWQFDFSPKETKPKRRIQAVVPKQLIPFLEDYLVEHRPHLLKGEDPDTLFLNEEGAPFAKDSISCHVSALTLRFGGKRVSPHLFRDIVAFAWLKDHPKDYLTLSKLLWHNTINITINTYGSQFNESSGVCAMESWLEERAASEAKQK